MEDEENIVEELYERTNRLFYNFYATKFNNGNGTFRNLNPYERARFFCLQGLYNNRVMNAPKDEWTNWKNYELPKTPREHAITPETVWLNPHLHKDFRVINISDELKPLLINTKSDKKSRNSPFVKMFIELDIQINANFKIWGITVVDFNQLKDKTVVPLEDIDLINTNLLMITAHVEHENKIIPFNLTLGPLGINTKTFPPKYRKMIIKCIDLAVCCIDLINNNSKDVEIIFKNKINIEQRIKVNKCPKYNVVLIRPFGKFKEYCYLFEQQARHFIYNCKFIVRGHFRHFYSDKWKTKKGEILWIKPYWKGQGLIKNNPYKVVK